jgi:protein CpxP
MKTKLWMAAAALLTLVLCGAAMLSYAQEKQSGETSGWKTHKHGRMGHIARELNLSDAQKEQIKDIMKANRADTLPLWQQMASTKKAMLAATANGSFDPAKVQAIANQQAQLMAQLTVQKQAIQHQVYTQVLTPDQRTKADRLRAQRIAKIESRLQKMSELGAAAPQQQ